MPKRFGLLKVLGLVSLLLTSGCAKLLSAGSTTDRVRKSVVRVVTQNGAGTGFYVKGPDGHSYVVTAFHVIEGGGPVSLLRYVDVGKSEHYVEALPEVEPVIYDREADIAILRARNVPDDKMPTLSFAEPVLDEPVRSYGFPASSLVGSLGLTVKDGKVLDLVLLPVVDRRTRRVIKQRHTSALITSAALESGVSGGPVVTRRGQVIGVNVQKDTAFQAQNAAVHAAVVRALLRRIGPATAPAATEVAQLVEDLQTNVLRLPVAERLNQIETDLMSLAELPPLRKYSDALWWSTESVGVQLALSMMPGKTLETTHSPEFMEIVRLCRARINPLGIERKQLDIARECGELPLRPLAWDLIASALHWDGKPHKYMVSTVEEVDPALHHYAAKVANADGTDSFFTLPLVVEAGRLKLRIFDSDTPIGLDSASKWTASDFVGTWQVRRHRTEHRPSEGMPEGTTFASAEKLEISITADGSTRVTHDVTSSINAPEGQQWACNNRDSVEVPLRQELVGKYNNGSVRTSNEAYDSHNARAPCSERCQFCGTYAPDKLAAFKRLGDQLIMYRWDGGALEQKNFERGHGSNP